MTTSQPYPFKHIGSFCLILFLALFRPVAIWPEVPVSTAPLAVLAAWVILLIKIPATVGYGAFFREHRLMLCLVAGYFVLCGASLIANYHRYPDIAAFVRWGLTFPIIQSAVVACAFLFTLPQNTTGPSITRLLGSNLLVFIIAAAIPAMTFWQVLDNKSAYQLYQYTIAGDMGTQGYNKRSILATRTDLGAISAILAVTALLTLAKQVQNRTWVWAAGALLVFALNTASGILSGSRGFFLAIGVGVLITAYQLFGGRLKLVLLSTPPLLLLGLLALLLAPVRVLQQLILFVPASAPIGLGAPPLAEEFTLNGVGVALGKRADLWTRTIDETLSHPWLGISNGGYRLLNESLGETPINNAHNAFLQLGVDAGVGGLLLGIVAVSLLLKKAASTARAPLFATILAGLLVDNFADHSLSWIAIATYTMASCTAVMTPLLTGGQSLRRAVTLSILGSIVLLAALIAQYYQKQATFNALPLAEQINRATGYFFLDYWNKPPVMITEAVALELKEQRREGRLRFYPSIAAADYCSYAYPGSKLLFLPDEQESINSSKDREMSNQWRLSSAPPRDCNDNVKDPSEISNWISNYDYYYGERLKKPNTTMLIITDYIAFFSPIFEASAHQQLTLNLTSKDLEGVKPTLVVFYYDAKSGYELKETHHVAESVASQVKFTLPPIPSGSGFLKLKLVDWRNDREKKLRQQVVINSISLRPEK